MSIIHYILFTKYYHRYFHSVDFILFTSLLGAYTVVDMASLLMFYHMAPAGNLQGAVQGRTPEQMHKVTWHPMMKTRRQGFELRIFKRRKNMRRYIKYKYKYNMYRYMYQYMY